MSYFHLTWDAKTNQHSDVIEGLTKLLCNDFNVLNIGRPIESTIVFSRTSEVNDVETIHRAIKAKYRTGFDFILSRVSRVKSEDKSPPKDYIKGSGAVEHEDGYEVFDVRDYVWKDPVKMLIAMGTIIKRISKSLIRRAGLLIRRSLNVQVDRR